MARIGGSSRQLISKSKSLCLHGLEPSDSYFFHLSTFHLRHGNAKAIEGELLARLRYTTQLAEDKSGDGLIVTFRDVQFQFLVRVVYRHACVDLKCTFIDSDELLFVAGQLVPDGANEFLYEHLKRDEASRTAILVDHDRHLLSGALHFDKEHTHGLRFRDEQRRAHGKIDG